MGRRSNGEGSLQKKANGKWCGQLMDGYREDGNRNIIYFTAKTKGEVLDKIRSYWNQKETGGKILTQAISFSDWADTWYADYKSQVQESTYSSYLYTLKVLKEYFCNMQLCDIKPIHINRFYDEIVERGLSHSYITKLRSMIIQIFDGAEANDLVIRNPARKSKMIRHTETKDLLINNGKDTFTQTEQEMLRKEVPDNIVGHSILLLLGSGLRSQELLALTPQDIAQDGSSVVINKAIKMVGGVPKLGSPKSKRGWRVVPVPKIYQSDALYLREHSGKPYIWTSKRDDGLFDVGVFRKQYYRTLSAIPGVRKLSPHCCRHTYISNLEKRGVPMEQIARLVGHSRISTTDGYLHTDMETLANAVKVLN